MCLNHSKFVKINFLTPIQNQIISRIYENTRKIKLNVTSYVSLWYFASLIRFKSEPESHDVVKY